MPRWLLIAAALATIAAAVAIWASSCTSNMRGNPIVSSTPNGKTLVTANLHGQGLHVSHGSAKGSAILEDMQIQHVEVDVTGEFALVSYAGSGTNYRIAKINLTSQNIQHLTDAGDWNDFFPTQKDEKTVLFWRSLRRSGDLFGGSNPSGLEVFALDQPSGSVKQITRGDYFNVAPIVVLGNGKRAVFRAFDTVYRLDLQSGTTEHFSKTNVEITPACRSVASDKFIAIGNTPGRFDYDLYEIDIDDGSSKRLTTGWGYIESVTYATQAGEIVAFVGHPRPSLRRLRVDAQ